MKKMHMLAVLIAASGLAGCATTQDAEMDAKKMAEMRQTEMDRMLQQRLAESASSINGTLELIERIERGSVGGPNGYKQGDVPDAQLEERARAAAAEAAAEAAAVAAATAAAAEAAKDPLDARMKIVWKNGPVDGLLKKMAGALGAEFKKTGSPSGALPMVSLTAESKTAREILMYVGEKVDAKADVVFVAGKPPVLELRYK